MTAQTVAGDLSDDAIEESLQQPSCHFLPARVGWSAIVALTLALFAAGAPILYRQLLHTCQGSGCGESQLSPAAAQALGRLGLSLHVYAGYVVGLEVLYVLGFCAIAALIARHRANDWYALFCATMLVLMGGMLFTEAITALRDSSPLWWWPVTLLSALGSAMVIPACYLFPDGRFVPGWTRWASPAWVALCLLGYLTPARFPLNQDPRNPSHLFPLLAAGFVLSVVAAQLYRYRRVAGVVERQQTKWVGFGFVLAFAGFFAGIFLIEPRAQGSGAGAVLLHFLGLTDFYAVLLLLPLALGIAILRFRLWDIDVIINRALVYSGLTAGVIGAYVVIVGVLGTLLSAGHSLVISLIATGLVALAFQPLHQRLQRGVNRLLYGERDEPYAVLARLGQRLESALAPEAVLPVIVETVAEALKLPYAAISLRQDRAGAISIAASTGAPSGSMSLLRLPLLYQHDRLGELILAPRAGEQSFSPGDLRLLEDLARQVGVAAHAVRLTSALQRSRESLVTTREEERRRLRRDLHDGLGPMLGSLTLKLDVADELLERDPAAAHTLLRELKGQAKTAIGDIRRLVYALRPAALDDLGLVSALREAAAEHAASGLAVAIEAPEPLPTLSAAVEVAVYHIAREAMTNVARHAQARSCVVSLRLDPDMGRLHLEIHDDGRGLSPTARIGIGLTSMRERAAELGGDCRIEPRQPSGTNMGTSVIAWLPLGTEPSWSRSAS